jgi:hypothetical protein
MSTASASSFQPAITETPQNHNMKKIPINVSVAKKNRDEYQKYIVIYLSQLITEAFQRIYKDACKYANIKREPENSMKYFQQLLREIRQWESMEALPDSSKPLTNEVNIITEKMPWLLNVLLQVLINHCVILISLRFGNKTPNQPLNMTKPNVRRFVHSIFVRCASIFRQDPSIFDHTKDLMKQKNLQLSIIQKIIPEEIYRLIPIDKIAKEYLQTEINTTIEDYYAANDYDEPAYKEAERLKTVKEAEPVVADPESIPPPPKLDEVQQILETHEEEQKTEDVQDETETAGSTTPEPTLTIEHTPDPISTPQVTPELDISAAPTQLPLPPVQAPENTVMDTKVNDSSDHPSQSEVYQPEALNNEDDTFFKELELTSNIPIKPDLRNVAKRKMRIDFAS